MIWKVYFYENNNNPTQEANDGEDPLPTCPFKTTVAELNTLTMQSFITRNNEEETVQDSSSNVKVDATGSWKSILA